MDTQLDPVVIGDLCAALLNARVVPGEDRPKLMIGDEDSQVCIDADFGSVAQSKLGVERLISVAREYVELLVRREQQ